MRILVTGGTGFIGTHLVQRLLQTDHHITCLVRKTSNTSILQRLGIGFVFGDVTDPDSISEAMNGRDCVMNLANVYSFWEADRDVYRRVNVDGTKNVMEAALSAGVAKVVHVSTCGVYGKPAEAPFTENSVPGPEQFSQYFRTKCIADEIAWEMHRNQNLPLVMVYPVGVMGPGDPKATGQYILRLLRRRMPARVLENAMFTFVHVRDVAEITYRAAIKEDNLGERYIAGKFQHTFGDINRMVSELSGVKLPLLSLPDFTILPTAWLVTAIANVTKKPPIWGMAIDQMRTMKEGVRADGSKAERELGISYTPIREAVEDAIDSFGRRRIH